MTKSFDVNVPSGSETPNLGDDRIRELKQSMADNFAEDHVMNATGSVYDDTDNGKHEKVSLNEQTSTPTTDAGFGILYSYTSDTELDLHYIDGSGNITQITSDGALDLAAARLDNDEYLLSIDNAGTGTVNLIKANTSDEIELGTDVLFPNEFVWSSGNHNNGSLANGSDNQLYQLVTGGDDTIDPTTDDGTNWRKFQSETDVDTTIETANKPVLLDTFTGTGSNSVDVSGYLAIEIHVTPSGVNAVLDYTITAGTGSVTGMTANFRVASGTDDRTGASSRHIVLTEGTVTITINDHDQLTNATVYGYPGDSQV